MRFREKGSKSIQVAGFRNGTSRSYSYNVVDGPEPRPVVKPTIPFTHSRHDYCSISDVVTPGFFKASKGGSLPVNPCSSTQSGYEGGEGRYSVYYYTDRPISGSTTTRRRSETHVVYDGSLVHQQLGTVPTPPPIDPAPLLVEAVQRARDELWDVGTSLAEMGKTVELITSLQRKNFRRMENILQGMLQRRRARRADLAGLADEFSNLWLSARYGWRPLAYEYESVRDAVDRSLNGPLGVVRKYATESSEATQFTGWSTISGAWQYRWRMKATRTVRGFVGAELNGSPAYIDPLVTGWELIPFSFVIDWFFNIGANLSAFSPFATGKVVWAGTSNEVLIERELETRVNGDYDYVEIIAPPFTSFYKTYSREAATPVMSLAFKPRFDGFKAADLVGLTYQALRRKANIFRRILGATSNKAR